MGRLSEIEKDSMELDDSVVQDFVQLKNDMLGMKVRHFLLAVLTAFVKKVEFLSQTLCTCVYD